MSGYFVSGSDFCTQGFERLRRNNEVMLIAQPKAQHKATTICREIVEDLELCDFGATFDYSAAKEAIRQHFKALAEQWNGASALAIFGRDAFPKNPDADDSEFCCFFIYLTIPETAQA